VSARSGGAASAGSAADEAVTGTGNAASPAATRWRLVIAYDGAPFRGFADQPGQPTVAGALGAALARALRLESAPLLTCAGRTDAGVHARHQVVHVDLPHPLPPGRTRGAGGDGEPFSATELCRSLNRQLAPSVVVRAADEAPAGFDARRSARSRRYRYLVWNAPAADPLLAPLAWHVSDALDLRALRAAADTLVGEHDFRAFCRRAPGTGGHEPIVRRVVDAGWCIDEGPEAVDASSSFGSVPALASASASASATGRLLRFEVAAASFCHQMVRSMVAAMVEVGRGRSDPARLVALLRSADRAGAPDPAPPHGLCLIGVGYDGAEVTGG
jgi:tRNA pseudouridine38-40 synthase